MFLEMSYLEIVFQMIALICNTYIAFTKKQKNIYIANFLFNVFAMLTGFVQNDYSLVISYLIIIYRAVVVIYKEPIKRKFKHFAFTFVIAHIVFGILTWQNIWSLITIVTPIFTGLILWYYDNLQLYRVNNVVNNGLWMIHNMHSKSYILVVTRVYAIVVNVIALIKNKKTCKKE